MLRGRRQLPEITQTASCRRQNIAGDDQIILTNVKAFEIYIYEIV